MRLTLIAHGATASTRAASFPGDEPLEALALHRAEALASRLDRSDRVWCGPELRCRQTAAALGLTAEVMPPLRDLDAGRWSGRSLADLERTEPAALAAWLADPAVAPHGGESLQALFARVAAWLEAPAEGRCLAIVPPAVVRAAVLRALAAPSAAFWRIDVAPLSVTRLVRRGNRWTLHLGADNRLD